MFAPIRPRPMKPMRIGLISAGRPGLATKASGGASVEHRPERLGPRRTRNGPPGTYASGSRESVRSRYSRQVSAGPRCHVSAKRPRRRTRSSACRPVTGDEAHPPRPRGVGDVRVQAVHLGPLDVDVEADVAEAAPGVLRHLAQAGVAEGVRAVHVDDPAVRQRTARRAHRRPRSGAHRAYRAFAATSAASTGSSSSSGATHSRPASLAEPPDVGPSPVLAHRVRLDRQHLVQAPPVARLPGEARGEERHRALRRRARSRSPAPPASARSCRRAPRPGARSTCRGTRPARMPRILLTAMDAPTPDPQIRIPRSACPDWMAWPTSHAKSG